MDGMILKRGSDSGKLKTIDEHYVATNGQTVFPIAYETFDYKKDTVFVISGRTTLSEGLDYTVVGDKITLVEGVPEGRTVTIRIMKNVNTDDVENVTSGAYIEDASIPLSKLAEDVLTTEEVANTYLPLTGGTLSGNTLNFYNGHAQLYVNNNQANLVATQDTNTSTNYRAFMIFNAQGQSDLRYAFRVSQKSPTANGSYNIFGDHNMPKGSYTGNGSSTQRTISINSVSGAIKIQGGGYFGIVGGNGSIFVSTSTGAVTGVKGSELKYANGVLTIAGTGTMYNTNGTTYSYESL